MLSKALILPEFLFIGFNDFHCFMASRRSIFFKMSGVLLIRGILSVFPVAYHIFALGMSLKIKLRDRFLTYKTETCSLLIIENLILDILCHGKLPLLHLTVSLSSDCCGILLRVFALSGLRSPALISGPRLPAPLKF